MENATKALEIAASVLIGLLILGCLVFVYTQITEVKKQEEDNKKIEQSVDFNQRFDTYNRDNLYGSDIFSVANMVLDYNNREAREKGYREIELEVIINNQVTNAKYFKNNRYDARKLKKTYDELTGKIKKINENKYKEKKVSYWSKFGTNKRLEEQAKQEGLSDTDIANLKNEIIKYNALKGELDDTARKTFKCDNIEYEEYTGRITKMEFSDY